MSVIIPDCTSCKHLYSEQKDGMFYCDAFPEGIPKEYFWGKVQVRELSECSNNVKFEEG